MKLFETKTAPNPRRVRIFLAEKGLLDQVEMIQMDLQRGDNLTPAFVAKNPMKKVPMLELDSGDCVSETMAICRYFEEAFPDSPPMLGRTPLEKSSDRSVAALDRFLFYGADRHGLSAHHRLLQRPDDAVPGVGRRV